jgi:16S rRNA (adenine1518-N6/adenine1519-N6)-dimethyltransferase
LRMARQPWGQNFLADRVWRERIIREVMARQEPKAGDGVWVEIGAGHGEMTSLLARHATKVIAIEIDTILLPGLRELASTLGNVTVVSGDVLATDIGALAEGSPYRVLGNIPYYITSPIVHHLFAGGSMPEAAFLVMQLEVAERLAARPGCREYGYLSAFAQFYAHTEILLKIPPGAFRPPPKVESALIALRSPGEGRTLGVQDHAAFMEFLKTCFAQKRKTLKNNLRSVAPPSGIEPLLAECEIRPDARAEQLGLAVLARVFLRLRED